MGKGKKIFIIVSLILVLASITSGIKNEITKREEAENLYTDYTVAYMLEDGSSICVTYPDCLIDENQNILVGFVDENGNIQGNVYTVEQYFKMIKK